MYLLTANPILIATAIIPAIILMVRVYRADKIEKEPRRLLVSLIILGIISTSIAMILETIGTFVLDAFFNENSLIYAAIMYFGVVAVSEEGAKYILLKKKTWHSPYFNYRFDGIVYAVFVSLGFALWENVGYVTAYGFTTAVVRAITAVPGHACFGVFMGYWYGLAKAFENSGNEVASKRARKLSLVVSVLMHGTYDFIATLDSYLFSLIFIAFVVSMFGIALRMVKRTSRNDYHISPY